MRREKERGKHSVERQATQAQDMKKVIHKLDQELKKEKTNITYLKQQLNEEMTVEEAHSWTHGEGEMLLDDRWGLDITGSSKERPGHALVNEDLVAMLECQGIAIEEVLGRKQRREKEELKYEKSEE